MIRLGVTGGIGSGKSTVSQILSLYGVPVYIADKESKKLTESSPIIREKLIRLFGKELYKNGTLNKPLLASYIFNDKNKLNEVNAIIHPEVKEDWDEWLQKNNRNKIVAQEAAILYESGFNRFMDKIILVYTPIEFRIQRVIKRDNISEEKVLERIGNQLSDEEKINLADFIIINDEKHSLIKQTLDIINSLKTSDK
ncbi:MAG: dephospho-CoA kinase [Prevotella sp.]|jgi:dephospho-CoA kinase|nr:dephospho-CoA kinase [Prevotella sp.]